MTATLLGDFAQRLLQSAPFGFADREGSSFSVKSGAHFFHERPSIRVVEFGGVSRLAFDRECSVRLAVIFMMGSEWSIGT